MYSRPTTDLICHLYHLNQTSGSGLSTLISSVSIVTVMVEGDIDSVKNNVEAPLVRFSQSLAQHDSEPFVSESQRLDIAVSQVTNGAYD
jgi:hypothetical protein